MSDLNNYKVLQSALEADISKNKYTYLKLAKYFVVAGFITWMFYWPAGVLIVLFSAIFFILFRKSSQLFIYSFVLLDKYILEISMNTDSEGNYDKMHESNLHQYILVPTQVFKAPIESPKTIAPVVLKHVRVNKTAYEQMVIGDKIEVVIDNNDDLYAYKLKNQIYRIELGIEMNGKTIITHSFIDQNISQNGRRL
ncbi:MAG: hypothetical protein JNM67_09010 [Bacteroidetes bacterium]|nr:hypothetical protein [Bacteroidota bacterium]